MSNLIASMARFSTTLTLYGGEQLEKTANIVGSSEELSKTVEEFEKTLDSLSDVLSGKIDEKKKDTMQSVTKMTEETVNRTVDGMELMDPRKVLKATMDLLQKTSDATASWVSRAASDVEKATGASKSKEAATPKA